MLDGKRALVLLFALTLGGCVAKAGVDVGEAQGGLVQDLCGGNSQKREMGAHLFDKETFGGNGRTCATCHDPATNFTISPAVAQARYAANPNDPLFLHDGSDDGEGHGVSRMLAHATIRITLNLPDGIHLANDPDATSVVVNRATFTLRDSPALERPSLMSDPELLWDGRAATLQDQALDAILTHAQGVHVTQRQLDKIALYETSEDFFTSDAMRDYACGRGPAPGLPPATTPSEERGREFFVSRPQPPGPPFELRCANCHSGPLLNEHDANYPIPGVLPGTKFDDVLVSEINEIGNPLYDFVVDNPDGSSWVMTSPDPGRILQVPPDQRPVCPGPTCVPCGALIPFNPALAPKANNFCAVVPFNQVNAFKIPTLRNIRNTAPYFHDNSADTLEAVMDHYVKFFQFAYLSTGGAVDGRLSPQDVQDIIAYMKLL